MVKFNIDKLFEEIMDGIMVFENVYINLLFEIIVFTVLGYFAGWMCGVLGFFGLSTFATKPHKYILKCEYITKWEERNGKNIRS